MFIVKLQMYSFGLYVKQAPRQPVFENIRCLNELFLILHMYGTTVKYILGSFLAKLKHRRLL